MELRVAIETYGCTMNQADSDIMRGLIARYFTLSDVKSADAVVINSCGVIEHTERKIIRRIQELKKAGKRVILAGCLPKISRKSLEMVDAAISPENVDKIVEAIKASFDGKATILDRQKKDKAAMHEVKCRLRENVIAIVSISEGCLGSCSFCATRFARGRLKSFSVEAIVKEVEKAVKQGFREIQLTSQDTGAYGLDEGEFRLPELLRRISEVDHEFRVRVGMMNPHHAVRMVEELVDAFSSEKIYKFIHVPVQSGDNGILNHMKRNHTVEDFVEVVEYFRKSFNDVMLSTDIIVGYPTETEEAFWKSYELIKEIKPDIVNITRFSPRKGTPAAKLKDMPDWIKKERSRILTRLCREIGYENNRRFVGKKMRVLVTRHGRKNMLARTNSYRPVITEGSLGEFKDVKIRDCTFNYLLA
jgi:MiaB-like tRNA modifying enzyme